MLVGYMRVSTDGDRQGLDLQRDVSSPPVSMNATCSKIASAAAGQIFSGLPARLEAHQSDW